MSELAFRPVGADDSVAIAEWIDSPELLLQWSGPADFSWPLSAAALEADARLVVPDRRLIAVVDAGSDAILGQASLRRDRARDTAQIGRVIVSPAARGRGVAVALMNELVRVGFDELNVHRLQLYVYDFNAPAIAAYQRAGFVIEGTLRETVRVGDGYWSLHVMGQLEPEYRTRTGPAPA